MTSQHQHITIKPKQFPCYTNICPLLAFLFPPAILKAWFLQTELRASKLQAPGTAQDWPGYWHLLALPYQPPLHTQQPWRYPLSVWRPLQPQKEENPKGMGIWQAPWKHTHPSLCDLWCSVQLREALAWSTHAAVSGWVRRGKNFDIYFLWEVCLG